MSTPLHVLRYALPFLLLLKRVRVHTVHNLAEREIEPRARWIQRYALNTGLSLWRSRRKCTKLERLYGIQRCGDLERIQSGQYAVADAPESGTRFGPNISCLLRFCSADSYAAPRNAVRDHATR